MNSDPEGLEPGTPWSVVRGANHCASLPPLGFLMMRLNFFLSCIGSIMILPKCLKLFSYNVNKQVNFLSNWMSMRAWCLIVILEVADG